MAISAADLTVNFSTKGAEKVTGDIGKVNKGITSFAAGVAKVAGGFLIGTALAGATRAMAGMVGGALDFERQMANVNSILQIGQDELATYSDALLSMAGRTAQAPQVLAAGLYDVASSGFAGKEGLVVLEAAANAATAGLTTTDVAARAITAGLNAYGLEADQAGRVSDVLFQTVNEGVITFDQLAKNLGNTLPIASSLGISIEELGAAYAQMTLKGVGASQAETQIAALMRSALNPTDQLTAAVQKHGFASAEAAIAEEGMAGFLKILTDEAGGSKEALFDLLGTQEAMNAATILGANDVEDYIASLERMNLASEDGGATQKALAKQMQSSAFQIQRAKVAVQTLAIVGFGILAPLVAKAAMGLTSFINRGLIPFGKVIASAFKGGFAFNELIKDLPQPLQRAAHAVGVIAEGIGDLIRDGFSANELRQIVGGLSALGDELLQGAQWVANIAIDLVTDFAGWLWDNRGAIWEGIKDLVGWGAGQFSDAITATITGAIELAGDIADVAGDLWGWITRKIMGGTPGGGMVGGVDPALGPKSIPIGTVLITGLLALGGALTSAGTWFVGAVQDRIPGAVDVGTVVIEATLRFAGDFGQLAADVQDGAMRAIRAIDWSGIPAALFTFGQQLGAAIPGLIVSAFNAVQAIPPSDLLSFAGKVALGLAGAFALLALSPVIISAAIVAVIAGAIKGAVDQLTPDSWDATAAGAKILGQLVGGITAAVGFGAALKDAIVGQLTSVVPTAGDFAAWAGSAAGALKDAAIAALKNISLNPLDYITIVGGGSGVGEPGAGRLSEFFPEFGTGVPGVGTRDRPVGLGGGGVRAMVLPAPDTTAFDAGIKGALDNAAKLRDKEFTTKLNADPSQFVAVIAASTTAGMAFASLTFIPKLNANPAQFVSVLAASMAAGVAFAAQTFTADIAGDVSPLAGALSAAYAAGYAWAGQTFTARFAIDTSPLFAAVAVAASVAQQIRDLMPSSPAKKGPLSKPISFAYIVDAARRDLSGLSNVIEGSIGGRRPLRPAIAGGGPRAVNITINGASDPEAVWRKLDRELSVRGL